MGNVINSLILKDDVLITDEQIKTVFKYKKVINKTTYKPICRFLLSYYNYNNYGSKYNNLIFLQNYLPFHKFKIPEFNENGEYLDIDHISGVRGENKLGNLNSTQLPSALRTK
jgi:hypothetical protein